MNFEVEIDHEGFKGKAVIDFPTRKEKLELLKKISQVNSAQNQENTEGLVDIAAAIGDIVDQRLISINVKHEESGIEITDKAYMDIYTECSELTGLISNFIIGGVSLGKPKS